MAYGRACRCHDVMDQHLPVCSGFSKSAGRNLRGEAAVMSRLQANQRLSGEVLSSALHVDGFLRSDRIELLVCYVVFPSETQDPGRCDCRSASTTTPPQRRTTTARHA